MRLLALPGLACLATCSSPPPPPPAPPTVVFVVLDNVRADRLSLCGYERRTTPRLESLCQRADAACTCGAVAPSSWTLPSHATFFTGLELPAHGAGLSGIGRAIGEDTVARSLGPDHATLAEEMARRGYRTALVSANPLLSRPSGLSRGFATARTAKSFGDWYNRGLVAQLEALLGEELSPTDGPLFLFVNVADAHQPWLAIPLGAEGFPPRDRLSFALEQQTGNPVRRSFHDGTLPAAERRDLVAHLDDVYDYAVLRADRQLRSLIRLLRKGGWLASGYRIVITSDHGEELGDHGLLGHAGPFLWEEMVRVPVVVLGESGLQLPTRLAGTEVFHLVRDGTLSAPPTPVRSYAYPSDTWTRWYGPELGAHAAAALWRGDRKLVLQAGRYAAYDLSADPGELEPLRLHAEERAALDGMESELRASMAGEGDVDPEMLELLRSIGYAD